MQDVMRKLIRRTAIGLGVLAALVFATGVWAISGRDEVYDLNQPTPQTTWGKFKRAVAYNAGQLVLPHVYDEHTRYAPGFKEETFESLPLGTSEADVRKALGEPLERHVTPDGRRVLAYSQQATGQDNYWVRTLVFDVDGRLVRRVADFYVD
jgi:hypothetical protein